MGICIYTVEVEAKRDVPVKISFRRPTCAPLRPTPQGQRLLVLKKK
jgi:hypothetical protein